ncbi:MAG: tetratricopeptide repeat protein [Kiritimatiellae bacterium]|jgi:tetratricopeptide (TPR) repeat protein|nr:tetratricopeptide repeat protein [Kiritimatiellia bacterium]
MMGMSETTRIDPYNPCPCGSGKKYKFCCYQKRLEREAAKGPSFFLPASPDNRDEDIPEGVPVGDMAEGRRLCDRGLRLMAGGNVEQAIPLFRQSSAAAPFVYTAANNLAICLFATGRLDEAIRTQAESLKAAPFPNPFGLANLATFYMVNGEEEAAQHHLEEALTCTLPSADACLKLCEVLSRFKRHREILDLVDKGEYGDEPGVSFFTGVAAANLNDRPRALRDLRRIPLGYYKAEMARRYLDLLKEKASPHTVRGDWPYLFSYEICPVDLIQKGIGHDETGWLSRRVVVDFCEAILNESAAEPENAFRMLIHAKHPEAVALLWLIVKGTFGPDSLRMEALQELDTRGELGPGQELNLFLNGERRHVAYKGTRLNPEFRFGKYLPEKLQKCYEKAVRAGYKKRPDWSAIGETYLRIIKEEPDYYPARYNFAISLIHRNRRDEAKTVLRGLVAEHPEYLFARATLLQILVGDDRMEEADALFQSADMPQETHPDAMVAWMVAQTLYHEAGERDEEAFRCIRSAHDLSPDSPAVAAIWPDYEDWDES